LSKRRREATTCRRQGLESERREQTTGSEIMRVGHKERTFAVQGAEAGSDVIEFHALIIVVSRHRDKRKSDFCTDR
jgi:hypothetical protein